MKDKVTVFSFLVVAAAMRPEIQRIRELQRKRKDFEEGQEKQAKFDDLLGKVIAAIVVLEGQIEQHHALIDQAQTITTRAIKRARLSTRHSDSYQDNTEAGPSHVSSTPRSTSKPPFLYSGRPCVKVRRVRLAFELEA